MTEVYSGISLNDLRILLKQEVNEVTLEDLYDLSIHFNEETKYLPREYKKEYIDSVLNVIIKRFALLKNDTENYEGYLELDQIDNVNKLLKHESTLINHILNVIVVYTTYLRKKPIHKPGTVFPGRVSIYCDGKNYFCPVKKYHMDNDKALCKYCIAQAIEE